MKTYFPSKCPSGRPVKSIKSRGIISALVWPFAVLIILQLITPSRCFCAGIGNSHFRSFAITTTFPERTFTLEPICRISIIKPLTWSKKPTWFCHIHLLKKWPYITSPESWNDMTTSCVSGCTLFGIRFNMEMLAASAPSPMLGILSEAFVPWIKIMLAPLISPKSLYGSGGGEKSPLILNVAIAEMDVIGRFNGSFFTSSISSLQASAKPRTTSAAIPNIKTRQPHFAIHFRRLKTPMFLESFSTPFSIQRPTRTITPPIEAASGQPHIETEDELKARITLPYLVCGSFVVLVAFFLAFWADPLEEIISDWIDKKKARKSEKRRNLAQKPTKINE